MNNFGKGGFENDGILIRNNVNGKFGNAFFATAEDGIPGRLTLYLWDTDNPKRVGSLDNTLLAHEFFHGVTNRLTGGPQKANCLVDQESKSLGEGWSDFFSNLMQMQLTDTRNTDFIIGEYAYHSWKGIRTHPYSTIMKRNPLTCWYRINRRFRF
jgi:extracellular elastinolytic metalloproteinase